MWTSCLSVAKPIEAINQRYDQQINHKMKEFASNLLFVVNEQHRNIKRKFDCVLDHSIMKQESTEDISILLNDEATLLQEMTLKYADVVSTLCTDRKRAIGNVFDKMHRISEKFGLSDNQIKEESDTKEDTEDQSIDIPPSKESESNADAAYNIKLLYQPGIDLKCEECGTESFRFHEDFVNHMAIKHKISKPYRCPEKDCDKRYGSRSNLISHIQNIHQKKRNYECDECHKQFYSIGQWKSHCRIHREEMEFKCQHCDKAFKQYQGLLGHIRMVHEKIRNYECDICQKEFYKKSNWESHCRTHRDEREFKCQHCDKAFKQYHGLYSHIRMVHEKIKNYQCEICQKEFYKKGNWESHCRTHRDEREFKCKHCDKAFKQKRGLHSHIKQVHEKIKNYQCNICQKEFYRKSNWTAHRRTHTGEKPFKCTKCEKCFSSKQNRDKHERKCCREQDD